MLVSKELVLSISTNNNYGTNTSTFFIYVIDKQHGTISIPLSLALKNGYGGTIEPRKNEPSVFKGKLREYQLEPVSRILEVIETESTVLIDMPTGFGKTVISSYISSIIGGRVAILMKNDLTFQWSETFRVFTNLRVHIYRNDEASRSQCSKYDVVIFTVGKIVSNNGDIKKGKLKELPRDIASSFTCLFVDECDTIWTETGLKAIKQFSVSKLCLLSATPERADKAHLVSEVFYNTKIRIPRTKPFTYNAVHTGIKGIERRNKDGIIFHVLTSSLMYNDARNKILVEYSLEYHRNITMIVTNELRHVDIIFDMLTSRGMACDKITSKTKKKTEGNPKGKPKNYTQDDKSSHSPGSGAQGRYVADFYIATIGSVGRGFDLSSYVGVDVQGKRDVDHLIVACTRKEDNPIEQLFGRAFRTEDPLISVLVDENGIIKNHNNAGIEWSNKNGCKKINTLNWDIKIQER